MPSEIQKRGGGSSVTFQGRHLGAGGEAQLVDCLLGIHEALNCIPSNMQNMVVHTGNTGTQEVSTGKSEV